VWSAEAAKLATFFDDEALMTRSFATRVRVHQARPAKAAAGVHGFRSPFSVFIYDLRLILDTSADNPRSLLARHNEKISHLFVSHCMKTVDTAQQLPLYICQLTLMLLLFDRLGVAGRFWKF
jgi:hypothetical protein